MESERWSPATEKSIILSYYIRDVCVFFSSNYEDFGKMNTRSGVTCERGEEAINRSVGGGEETHGQVRGNDGVAETRDRYNNNIISLLQRLR